MRKLLFIAALAVSSVSCSNTQAQKSVTKITAEQLKKTVETEPNIQLIDVRTPDEFKGGHVKHAVNIDWRGNDFAKQTEALDKSKPTYVYCLSGGRSGQAVASMEKQGFTNIIEMGGGMMEWRNKGLEEEKNSEKAAVPGMTKAQFDALLDSKKLVLIDFYADWCAPCKKIKPFLDNITKDMGEQVTIVRIDADANPELCSTLGVEGLPTLKLYKNKKEVWNQIGFINEKGIRSEIKKASK